MSNVDHPQHYNGHPSGVECIDIVEDLSFCLGNVVKYLWRAELKNGVEDIQKAQWYLDREIARVGHGVGPAPMVIRELLLGVVDAEDRGNVAGVFRAIAEGDLALARWYLVEEAARVAVSDA